jgi:hypothetical protein
MHQDKTDLAGRAAEDRCFSVGACCGPSRERGRRWHGVKRRAECVASIKVYLVSIVADLVWVQRAVATQEAGTSSVRQMNLVHQDEPKTNLLGGEPFGGS